MDRIVDTEPDGEDDVDARDDVDGDVPEVEEADDVSEGDDDDADDVDADADVCEQHKGDQGHRGHGKPDVSPELKSDYLVCLPGSVDFAGDQIDHGRVFLNICQTFAKYLKTSRKYLRHLGEYEGNPILKILKYLKSFGYI